MVGALNSAARRYCFMFRIGKIQQAEENEARIKLERERLELLRLRATGRVEVEDDDEEGADDDSLHK